MSVHLEKTLKDRCTGTVYCY